MEIKAEKWNINDNDASYKVKSIDRCCDKLIQSEYITLNNEYCEDNLYSDGNEYSVKLVRQEEDFDIWEDYHNMIFYYEKINYCPYCGERINIEIVGEVNKTEEYNRLKQERDTLWKKCRKTDSKTKEQELQKQVSELDDKINEMYCDDDLMEVK